MTSQRSSSPPGPNSGVADDQVGDLAIAVQHRDSSLWTVPPSERARAENRRLTLCVRAGAAVAALLLGALWGSTPTGHGVDASRARRARAKGCSPRAYYRVQDKAAADGLLISQSTALIDAVLGRHTSWLGALALPPQDDKVRLTIVSVEGARSRMRVRRRVLIIHGRVERRCPGRGQGHSVCRVARTASPLVASCGGSPPATTPRAANVSSRSPSSAFPLRSPLSRANPASERVPSHEAPVPHLRARAAELAAAVAVVALGWFLWIQAGRAVAGGRPCSGGRSPRSRWRMLRRSRRRLTTSRPTLRRAGRHRHVAPDRRTRDFSLIMPDDAVNRLATASSVKVMRPDPAGLRQVAGPAAAGGAPSARGEVQEYRMTVQGTYESVARFIHACEHSLGTSSVAKFLDCPHRGRKRTPESRRPSSNCAPEAARGRIGGGE